MGVVYENHDENRLTATLEELIESSETWAKSLGGWCFILSVVLAGLLEHWLAWKFVKKKKKKKSDQ